MNSKIRLTMAFIAMGTAMESYAQQITSYNTTGNYSGTPVKERNDQSYRVFNNTRYEIVDSTGFFLYKRTVPAHINKGPGTCVPEYSFSVNNSSPVRVLTIDHLKAAFPDNATFHYLIDAIFSSDKELMDYDMYLRMYKVKYLFSKSIK